MARRGRSGRATTHIAETLEPRFFLSVAPTFFQGQQTFATGSNPRSVALADVNGDGKSDMIVANQGSNSVSVFLGNGNGTFGAPQTFAVGPGPDAVAVADVNGDGKPDLVVANGYGVSASVLLGNGDGTFATQQTFYTGAAPLSVAVADVNADGKPDLVIAINNAASGNASVLLGNGDGSFQPQNSGLPTPLQAGDILVSKGDRNQSLLYEITPAGALVQNIYLPPGLETLGVTVSPDGNIHVIARGQGTFLHSFDFATQSWVDVIPGNMDINSATYYGQLGSDSNYVYAPSDGAGSSINAVFRFPLNNLANYSVLESTNGASGVTAGEDGLVYGLNGDFHTNIQVYDPVTLQRVQEINTFTTDRLAGIAVLPNGNMFVTPFDNPKVLDEIDRTGAVINSLTFPGSLGGMAINAAGQIAVGGGNNTIYLTDINLDSFTSFTTPGTEDWNQVSFVPATTQSPAVQPGVQPATSPSTGVAMSVADVNRDGKPDLITVNSTSNVITVSLGNGDGTFKTAKTFSTGAIQPYSVATADVNGDGKPDVIAGGPLGVAVFLGNGNGTFAAPQTLAASVAAYPGALAIADLNGDGKADIVVADAGANTVGELLGNGDGTFAAQQTFAVGLQPDAVTVNDVNRDGRLDIVAANGADGTVSVLLGDPPPVVQQINRIIPTGPSTTATSVIYTVTFNEAVTGVDATDFALALNGVTAATPVVVAGSSAGYTVTVNGIAGTGTLGLNLVNNGSIHDAFGTQLGPSGTFTTQHTYATGSTPTAVAVADVNGDGKGDLLVANDQSNSVSAFPGNGDGTFGAQQTFAAGTHPISLAVGDFNGDGKIDLAFANSNNRVSVLLGNGNGTFKAATTFAAGNTPSFVAAGDVNADGKTDLIVADNVGNTVSVLLGNGDGTFQAPQTYSTGTGSSPDGVAVADVNGDGKPDVIVSNKTAYNLGVFLGNGDGTFQPQQTFAAVGSPNIYPTSVAVTDLNGDGKPDLLYTTNSNTVGVLLGIGNGTFAPRQTFAVSSTGTGVSAAVVDVNGDGVPDLVATLLTDAGLNVLHGNGDGTFSAPQPVTNVGSFPEFITAADLNGDGKTDVVAANENGNSVSVVLADSTGNFTGPLYNFRFFQAQQTFAIGNGPSSVAIADVNGDGKPDIIAGNGSSNSISVALGNGNGTFQAQQTFATGAGYSVTVADVNGDGKLDLVAVSRSSSIVSVLLGNGNGTFAAPQTFAAGTNPYSVALGDVNGDGKLDLVVGSIGSPKVSVLLGNGNGTFQAQQTIAVAGSFVETVALGDFNFDGKLDIAITTSGNVGVMLGNGNGTFKALTTFATDGGPRALAVADVNGDGKPDLITGNYSTNTLGVLLGNGNGTFQTQQTFYTGTGTSPWALTVADVNTDGKLDLIETNSRANTVGVLLGNGNGTFGADQTFATGSNCKAVAVADLNADGKPDLVVADSGKVGVLFGLVQPFVQSINRTSPAGPTDTSSSVVYTVTFSEPVTGVDPTDFALALSGTVTATTPVVVAGSGAVYTVTINGISGVGALGLNLVNNGSIQDSLGNALGPNGTFQTQQLVATTANPYVIATADVNGDGKPDLIVSNRASANVGVLLGNGNGTFGPEQLFSTGTSFPLAMAVADVNGDGKPDIIAAETASNAIGILLGNGNGTFAAQKTVAAGASPRGVTVADVNGNGKADLIVTNNGSSVSVFLGNGNGTFAAPTSFATGPTPTPVAVADVNGDGKPDLIVGNYQSGNVGVLLGNGNGTFAAQQTFATLSTPNSIVVADMNGDGKLDLVVANKGTNGGVSVLLGNGNGTFAAQQTFAAGSASTSVAAVDVNGDDKLDLVVTNMISYSVSVLLGKGDGTFLPQETFGAGGSPNSVAVSDVNGDGKADLVVAGAGGKMVTVLLNDASGNFTGPIYNVDPPVFQPPQAFPTSSFPTFVTVADLNRDGKLDLVVTNRSTGLVSVLLGNGNGTFASGQTFAAGSRPYSVAVSDVNGDGQPDLIVANGSSKTVSVLLGNGNETFAAQQTLATGSSPTSVAVSDVNGDGILDLIASGGTPVVSVLLGNGNGTFAAAHTFSTGTSPSTVVMSDVNGDGLPDIVVANSGANTVSVLLGNGNGTFAAQHTFAAGVNPFTLAVADVNGDGKPDIVAANAASDTVSVLLGNGNGTFTSQQTFAAGARPYSVALVDVNGDGKPDIVVADRFSGAVGVLLGNGDGTFQPQVTYAAGASPYSVAVADVNADGRPDLIATNYRNSSVSVLLGDAPPVVQSINRTTPAGPTDTAASVTYTVTFSKPVTGVDATDFSLAPSGVTATTPVVVAGSGAVYTVTINGISGAGTLGLNLMNDGSIQDSLGNPLGPTLNFQTTQTISTGPNLQPYSVQVADVNGDGKGDLIVDNFGTTGNPSGDLGVMLGNGNGTFQAEQILSAGAGNDPMSVAVADVSGDGKPDLVVADADHLSVDVLLGNGNGTFQSPLTFASTSPVAVKVADVNGDGKPDLIVTNPGGSDIGVLIGNGNGTFQAVQTFSTGAGTDPVSLAVADLNGDGKTDLIFTNFAGGLVGILFGNGNGTFQAPQTFATGANPSSIAVADVNGDGKPDLIVTNINSYDVSVLLGNGNGTFLPQQTFSTGPNSDPESVAVADINGDGKVDLIFAAAAAGGALGVLLGNGDGTFQAPQTFSTGASVPTLAVADLNGDGRLDIVEVNPSPNSVDVLPADASGNFTGQTYTIGAAISATVTSAATDVPGQATQFTITVSNDGQTGATGVAVSDILPAGILADNYVASDNGLGATGYTAKGNGNIADTVNLPVGASITYLINAMVSSSAIGTITDSATAATAAGVINTEANVPASTTTYRSSATVTLTPQADVYVAISGSDPLSVGGTDVYTIVVTNHGFSAITGVAGVTGLTVADPFTFLTGATISSTVLFGTAAGNSSGALPAGGLNDILTMSAGAIVEYTIIGTVSANAPTTLSSTVNLTLPVGTTDPVPANNSSSVSAAVATGGGTVVSRSIFYGDSVFDGSNVSVATAPTTADFAAIAPDKVALLPGQTATFNNYTGYVRGINGIFVDLTGDVPGNIVATDFAFKVGNTNPAGTGWTTLTIEPTVTPFATQGVAGSDRIALTWPDGTIAGKWLQVTVNADGNTGLSVPDVFYFGNAPGESGNSTTDAGVNATDEVDARNDPHSNFSNPAPIADPNDFNRDARTNATDEVLARVNTTNFQTRLVLLNVPASPMNAAVSAPAVMSIAAQATPTALSQFSVESPSIGQRMSGAMVKAVPKTVVTTRVRKPLRHPVHDAVERAPEMEGRIRLIVRRLLDPDSK